MTAALYFIAAGVWGAIIDSDKPLGSLIFLFLLGMAIYHLF